MTWRHLRPHAMNDRLLLVRGGLALIDAGLALANDDSESVQGWIESRQLVRPSKREIRVWESGAPGFRFLILSPFVLAEIIDPARSCD